MLDYIRVSFRRRDNFRFRLEDAFFLCFRGLWGVVLSPKRNLSLVSDDSSKMAFGSGHSTLAIGGVGGSFLGGEGGGGVAGGVTDFFLTRRGEVRLTGACFLRGESSSLKKSSSS